MSRTLLRRNSNISDESLSSVLESRSITSISRSNSLSSTSSIISRSSSKKKKKSKIKNKMVTPKLSQRNIMGHIQAIRPPNLFRTPQPKFRPKSKNKRRNCHLIEKKNSKNTNNISVAIRLRPLNNGEIRNGMKPIWSVKGTSTLKQIRGTISSYNFEYVCPGIHDETEGSTLNLYNAITKRIVLSSCKGKNGCIFAYGQTSSGKTYTMLGTDTDPGITLLALSDIFHFIRNDKQRKYALFISYIEIHNEILNDLLNRDNTNLRIIDTPSQGPIIKNCTETAVKTPQDVIQLLLKGEKLRKVSETHSNQRSSRSHAIFRIFIQSQLRNNEKKNNHKTLRSVLNLVDLAGSESNSNIDDENIKQAKEAKHINQSLLCLGRVILALSSKQKHKGYIPYRDSKLTRILQPSLGGNANTSIICTMSPCANCLDESLNTLRFAQFSTKIKCHAIINESIDDKTKLRKYMFLVKNLKKQINEYTKKSDKMKQIYAKMKKLKKQNASLQTKIKKEKQNRDIMARELAKMKKLKNKLPSTPQTPRLSVFVSTSKDTQSEPEYNDNNLINSDISEYSVNTPSTVHSAIIPQQIDQFAKVIMGLQNKLEEVQGNIETLTYRISNAQFVEINSIASPKQNLTPPNKSNLSPSNLTAKLMDAMNEFEKKQNAENISNDNNDCPVIAIDLIDGADDEIDDTPDLPQEKELNSLNNRLQRELDSEKKHSAQLLHMISGTKLLKLNPNNDQLNEIKLWLQVQHLLDDSRPNYQICWKKTVDAQNKGNISLKLLNSKLAKPNILLLSSVSTVLCGQQTQIFNNSKQKFTEQQEKLSFSLILNKGNESVESVDFICYNQTQNQTWIQCLNRLLLHSQNENVNDSNCHQTIHSSQPFVSGTTSLNTTLIEDIVEDFFKFDQVNPSYPLSSPQIDLETDHDSS